MGKIDEVRAGVINTLLRWHDNKLPIDECINRTLRRKNYSLRGRRFFTSLVYGTLRHMILLDHIVSQFSTYPLESLPLPIQFTLRMAVFQILFCDSVTLPAAIHTSVDLARTFGHNGLAKIVNAILRKIPERLEDISLPTKEENYFQYLSVRYSVPKWILEEFEKRFGPDKLESFCQSVSDVPSISIRTNLVLTSREELQRRLHKIGISAQQLTNIPEELTLPSSYFIADCPLMKQGLYTVQDPASMLAVYALNPQPGEYILDMCSAPGTKATHISEYTKNESNIFAIEHHPGRINRIVENMKRLKCQKIIPICANGLELPFPNEFFDRVLLDAPCSGLGTLRRNPDIKYRMNRDSIIRLSNLQKKMLKEAYRVCKRGGIVVYSVCTFTQEETEHVIQSALEDCKYLLVDGSEILRPWRTSQGQYQTLPLESLWDGFFLTVLRKE